MFNAVTVLSDSHLLAFPSLVLPIDTRPSHSITWKSHYRRSSLSAQHRILRILSFKKTLHDGRTRWEVLHPGSAEDTSCSPRELCEAVGDQVEVPCMFIYRYLKSRADADQVRWY